MAEISLYPAQVGLGGRRIGDIQGDLISTCPLQGVSVQRGPAPYSSESPNSARPALEFRYSFLPSVSTDAQAQGRVFETVPMCSPVHYHVSGNEWRRNIKNLGAETPPGVEDGVVKGTGEGILTVRADSVGNDSLLLHAT